ncbi:hypothetical protein JCM5350_005257 [Sporobolomyces pararoseus]
MLAQRTNSMIRSISLKNSYPSNSKSLVNLNSRRRSLSTIPNTPPRNAAFLQNEKNLMWLSGIGLLGIGTYWWVQKNENAKKKLVGVKEQVKQGGGGKP